MNEKPRAALAVALHYNGNGAPRVVAKGGGGVADKIIETAREHRIPLEEDAALATALSRLDLGKEVPRELYVAVANVLAFAWAVAGKRKVDVKNDAMSRSTETQTRPPALSDRTRSRF